MKNLLFLCTGNYYRSRFAEELFNAEAQRRKLAWCAVSAGLKVKETRHQNPGKLSFLVPIALRWRGIEPARAEAEPMQLEEKHLERADRIIATCRREHEPMVKALFPQYLPDTQFWEVEDIGFEEPGKAMLRLGHMTLDLMNGLSDSSV